MAEVTLATTVILTGLLGLVTAVVGAIVGATVGYRLGHRKTRYDKQTEVLIELRRRFLGLTDQFLVFSVPPEPGGPTLLEHIENMESDVNGTVDYFRSKDIHLHSETTEQIRWIVGGFLKHFVDLRAALKADVTDPPTHGPRREDIAVQEMEKWREVELPQLLDALEHNIRELLGTQDSLWDVLRGAYGSRQ